MSNAAQREENTKERMTMLTAQLTAKNVVGTERDFSVRTGVLQFKHDWPGIFIRGDDALGYATMIRKVLKQGDAGAVGFDRLEELADLLESCSVKTKGR
jgi:hypothetical protein